MLRHFLLLLLIKFDNKKQYSKKHLIFHVEKIDATIDYANLVHLQIRVLAQIYNHLFGIAILFNFF